MSYECSPIGGGCGERFRSQDLFDRHLQTASFPATCATDMAAWSGVVRDTYGCWSTASDAQALSRKVARLHQDTRSTAMGQTQSDARAVAG